MEEGKEVIIGIDLAALEKTQRMGSFEEQISTHHLWWNEIVNLAVGYKPHIVALDAPLTRPKTGIIRRADREMLKQGCPVFPPLSAQSKLLLNVPFL